uniref:Uncharacterized protein n=1 Tax=viral metagenome TaxID=1070528 RepID=A0A6C0J471_9ZZZZ
MSTTETQNVYEMLTVDTSTVDTRTVDTHVDETPIETLAYETHIDNIAEKRLEYEMKRYIKGNFEGTLTIFKEGIIGERIYDVTMWGWRIRITPTISYPYEFPHVQYMLPYTKEWKNFTSIVTENGIPSLQLIALAQSIIVNIMEK